MAGYRVLSLDGGGIKGLFTARVLERLAGEYPRLLDRVDLIAGTSTGGIIALGLAAGRSPGALAALYRERGPAIFDDSFWDDLRDLGRAIGADYGVRNLRTELQREFGGKTLGQLAKKVLVPSFDLDSPATDQRPRMWKPKFFHNFPGEDSDAREKIVDVALRTSAAPAYFPTYQGFVDGGVVANNPSMAALAQALDPRAAGRRLSSVALLSVSAGTDPRYIRGRRKNWGWVQWAGPLVSLMVSGVTGVADFQCRQLLGRRYFRLDRVFGRGVNLDDVRKRTLDYLDREAEATDLEAAVAWLKRVRW